jgi:hypothetical protein
MLAFGRALWSGRRTQLLQLAQGVDVGPALPYLALLKERWSLKRLCPS